MAQKQTKVGRLRMIINWFGQHKATACLVMLVVAALLCLIGSWAVLQVRIHAEREKFQAVITDVESVVKSMSPIDVPVATIGVTSDCSRTDTVWGQPSVEFCEVNEYSVYASNGVKVARSKAQEFAKRINKKYVVTIKNEAPANADNVGTYSLQLGQKGISCFIDYWYYTASRLPLEAKGFHSIPSQGLLSQISCTGRARVEQI